MKNILIVIMSVLSIAVFTAGGFAQSPQDELTRMVAQLRTTPTDIALREKIIKLASEMKPGPVVPEDAIRFEGRAQFAFKKAQSEAEFLNAAAEYEKAVSAAPWVSGYYSDLCTIYEKANKFQDAKRNCGFYLVSLNDANEITDLKRRIAGLDYGVEQAEKAKAKAEEAANSPQGKAQTMLAILNKKYAGTVGKLLICGVNLNQYWYCTDKDAASSNWVNSVTMNAFPPPKPGTARYRIVGAEEDMIEVKLGDYGAGGDSFRMGCAKPSGTDPNSMSWIRCPGWENGGQPMKVEVRFFTADSGSPVIEYKDALPCDSKGCRRAQFVLQP